MKKKKKSGKRSTLGTLSKRKQNERLTKKIKPKPSLQKTNKKSIEKRSSRKGASPILKIDETGHIFVDGVKYYVGKHKSDVIYKKGKHLLQSAKYPNITYSLLEAIDA